MAHFYGSARGNRREATRCGSKDSGYKTEAASWDGAVTVELFYNEDKNEDWADVCLRTHHGAGSNINLYYGPVSGRDFERFKN